MKLRATTAAMFVGVGVAASDAAAYRVQNPNTLGTMHSGVKPIGVVTGDNPLRTFFCSSTAGCIVVMSASEKEIDTVGTQLCSFVDGIKGVPGCSQFGSAGFIPYENLANDQLKVGKGTHTVQTIVSSLNPHGKILGWQVTYTIFELPITPQIRTPAPANSDRCVKKADSTHGRSRCRQLSSKGNWIDL